MVANFSVEATSADVGLAGALATLVADDVTYLDLGDGGPSSFGSAMAWWSRHGRGKAHLIADEDGAASLARWATILNRDLTVWSVAGNQLTESVPEPLPAVIEPPAGVAHLVAELQAAGADIVVEHGIVRGETLGIEVGRIVEVDGEYRIEPGVGRYDQEATALLSPEISPATALAAVIEQVKANRTPGTPAHPLHRLARERWLRSVLMSDSSSLGVAGLASVEPTVARHGLRDVVSAPAVGTGPRRSKVLVVVSVGVDLGVLATTADLISRHQPDQTMVVVPGKDALPILRELVELLPKTVLVTTEDLPWLP